MLYAVYKGRKIHFRKLYKNVITEITILKGEILIAEYLCIE